MNTKKCLLLLLCWMSSIQLLSAQSNALNFDGVNDHVLTTFVGPTGNQARTVEAWIRTTANANPNAGGTQKVILDWGNMATGERFTFNLLFSNGLRIEVQGSGLNSTRPLNDGLWHHVAAVYNPALTTNQFKLYVDGLPDTAGNIATPVNTSNTNALRIGQRLDGLHFFNGDIDEVRCWNVALSDTDILNSYNREYCNLPTALAAYYTMNEGLAGGTNTSEIIAYDRIANNHGILQNFGLSGTTSNWVQGNLNSPTTTDTQQVTACITYTSLGGTVLTSSGVVTDTLASAAGCDSIVRQEVVIRTVNTGISLSQFTLAALSTTATAYQWLNCSNGFSAIAGANQAQYTPASNGSYAVVVTEAGCTDTSNCLSVTGVSVQDILPKLQLSLYPNPSTGLITITTDQIPQGGRWQINDLQGRIQRSGELAGSRLELDVTELAAGHYVLQLLSKNHAPAHLTFVKR